MVAFARGETPYAVATLEGYAGVGKTTVVGHVVETLVGGEPTPFDDVLRVVVCAPTHKAVSVLAEKMGHLFVVELVTLHSVLGLRLQTNADGTQGTREEQGACTLHEFDLAVIDEASMIGPGMFEAILSKRSRCRILFVGDPAQLPPVEDSDALSPAFGPAVPVHWRLSQVVRQAKDNPIIRMATVARQCIELRQDFSLAVLGSQLQPGDDAFVALQPGSVAEVAHLVADAICHGQDTRAMAWDNATVQAINANVHALVHAGRGEYPDGTLLMAQEAFTAVDSDNLSRKVHVRNSALLTVTAVHAGQHPDELGRRAWRLQVVTDGHALECWVAADQRQWQADISGHFAEYRRLKLREQMASGPERHALREQARHASASGWALRARYAPLRYAYAMTVHKAQGSTFDAVVIAWDSFQRCRDVQQRNRLAYVGLTRTRRFAVVCA
jgi:exodeoxyribonuclease V